jgi:hypothetical protein
VVLEAERQLFFSTCFLIDKYGVLRVVVPEKAYTFRGEMYKNAGISKKLPLFVMGK